MKTNLFFKVKVSILICFLSFTYCPNVFSQSQKMAFLDWHGEVGTQNFFYKNVTKTDSYGNTYIVGATINSYNNYDILLAKYNRSGTIQ